jgi:uncharacterized protein YcfJ
MKTLSKIGIGAVALTMLASTPAAAQNYRDRDRDNTGRDAVVGAVVGGLAGAIMGQGDGRYVAGGALAGAALGAASSDRGSDCNYYRGGRCYRNQGHWERDHGINSKNGRYNYSYDRRDNRYDRRHDNRRDYRYDRRW